MGAIRQATIFLTALTGAIGLSQAPEFAQQYRQRIGGAIEELQRVVAEFDRDATQNGMTRVQALDAHARAEPLFRDRGRSMESAIGRLDHLSRQSRNLAEATPLEEPFVLFDGDEQIVAGVWRDFKPAVPVTPTGFAWGAAGFFVAAAIAWFVLMLLRQAGRSAVSVLRRPARPAARG